MNIFTRRVSRFASLVLLLLLALTACGKKGPVRPLLVSLPAAPPDLRISQQGESFILGWDIPTQNQDGTDAEELGGFRIYRNEYPVAEGCPTCREPQELAAKIDLDYPIAQRVGKRFYWRDLNVVAGSGYNYRITPVTRAGREGEAATAHRDWMPPPQAPEQFQVLAEKDLISLSWQPPAQLPAGAVLAGYNLYRHRLDRPFIIVPLNPQPLENRQITDRTPAAGQTYEYRVSTVIRLGETLLESAPSEGVKVTRKTSE
jgi:hypothetical protein